MRAKFPEGHGELLLCFWGFVKNKKLLTVLGLSENKQRVGF